MPESLHLSLRPRSHCHVLAMCPDPKQRVFQVLVRGNLYVLPDDIHDQDVGDSIAHYLFCDLHQAPAENVHIV